MDSRKGIKQNVYADIAKCDSQHAVSRGKAEADEIRENEINYSSPSSTDALKVRDHTNVEIKQRSKSQSSDLPNPTKPNCTKVHCQGKPSAKPTLSAYSLYETDSRTAIL